MQTTSPIAFDLSSFGKLRLAGKDRAGFLQNFTTNDVIKPGVGQGCETFLTTAQARIVAWLRVAIRPDELYMNMEPGLTPQVIAHLERYIIGEAVTLEDRTQEDFLWLVQDETLVGNLLLWQQREEASLTIQRCDFLGCPSVFLWGRQENREAARRLWSGELLSIEDPRWNTLRVQAVTPAYGIDFDETNLPQEVNRTEQAISFTKGCYIGQETVARIRAYGHVNKQLKRVQFAGTAAQALEWHGAALQVAGKEVGKLKTVAYSEPAGCLLAFAMIRKEHLAAGAVLQAVAAGKSCDVTVLA